MLAKGLPAEAAFKNQRLCLPLKSLQGRSTAQMTITGTSDTMLSETFRRLKPRCINKHRHTNSGFSLGGGGSGEY